MKINDEYPKDAGIYKLTCINNNKVYIGKAVNIYNRLIRHGYCEKKSKGRFYFENAIIKHGWASFEVEILEIFKNFDKLNDNTYLLEREAYYIKLFDTTNPNIGYNICKHSIDRTGVLHSEEAKRKMSVSRMGKKFSDETKEKMRKSSLDRELGKNFSDEHIESLRQARLGNTNMLGVKHSQETKEKISRANTGRKMSEESKEKIRQFRLGKKHSNDTREKIQQSSKNRVVNTEENGKELRSTE